MSRLDDESVVEIKKPLDFFLLYSGFGYQGCSYDRKKAVYRCATTPTFWIFFFFLAGQL